MPRRFARRARQGSVRAGCAGSIPAHAPDRPVPDEAEAAVAGETDRATPARAPALSPASLRQGRHKPGRWAANALAAIRAQAILPGIAARRADRPTSRMAAPDRPDRAWCESSRSTDAVSRPPQARWRPAPALARDHTRR